MKGDYQSPNVEGLYFAGTASHAQDYKKSSGGFIHGKVSLAMLFGCIISTETRPSPCFALLAYLLVVNTHHPLLQAFGMLRGRCTAYWKKSSRQH